METLPWNLHNLKKFTSWFWCPDPFFFSFHQWWMLLSRGIKWQCVYHQSSRLWSWALAEIDWRLFLCLIPFQALKICLADLWIYHDCRYTRSQSCPFCRGSLKRVRSRDLWVLTGDDDVVDPVTLEKENVRHFLSFIDSLPLILPDNMLLVYYDYLIWQSSPSGTLKEERPRKLCVQRLRQPTILFMDRVGKWSRCCKTLAFHCTGFA